MHRYGSKASLLILGGVLALALLALAWMLGQGPSQAEDATMHHCPQPGKWAIAVWGGDDGTDASRAFATCGEGAVVAAYYIHPTDQYWLRWFVGQAGTSNLLTLDRWQGVIALGAVGAPSPSPTPTPTPTGQYSFTFPSFYGEPDTFRGRVEEIRIMESIPPSGDTYAVTPPAGGQFAVLVMAVTNIGNQAAQVGSFSFRLRDDQGRVFKLVEFAELMNAQMAAEAYFDRAGVYEVIMPGITLDMVFAFLVPEGTTGLVAERCPDSGC